MQEAYQDQVITLAVPSGQRERIRLDVYITGFIENTTRSKVQQSIKEGQVTVNGEVLKASYIVQPGDRIECRVRKPPPIDLVPQDIPLDIVYEDDVLIVVNKPPGLVVHPAYGHPDGTLVNALLYHVGGTELRAEDLDEMDDEDVGLSTYNAAPRFEGDPAIRPGLVHRLDKDTSGLMVVAKNDAAHAYLAEQFAKRTIRRAYRAIVWGIPEASEGRIETHLGRDPRDRKRVAVVQPPQGKHAVTHYRVVEALPEAALVEFRLETGRTHQIRVHARHLGYPVFGDPTYEGQHIPGRHTARRKAFYQNLFKRLPRQALHAYTLGFRHPASGETLYFSSALPDDMQDVLDRLRAAPV